MASTLSVQISGEDTRGHLEQGVRGEHPAPPAPPPGCAHEVPTRQNEAGGITGKYI